MIPESYFRLLSEAEKYRLYAEAQRDGWVVSLDHDAAGPIRAVLTNKKGDKVRMHRVSMMVGEAAPLRELTLGAPYDR